MGEIEDERAFLSLFATLLNILSFFIICLGLLSHHEVYAVQEAIGANLANNVNFAYSEFPRVGFWTQADVQICFLGIFGNGFRFKFRDQDSIVADLSHDLWYLLCPNMYEPKMMKT